MVLRVPWESRHTSVGWGDRPRVYWKGQDNPDAYGMELRRGDKGITARDEHGTLHMLPHGSYQVGKEELLLKASAGPFFGPRGGKWADPAHKIPWKVGHHAEVSESGRTFRTGYGVVVPVTHRKQKTQNFGARYGQDIEPAGRYVVHGHNGEQGTRDEGWGHKVTTTHDTVHFRNPLVIHHGGTGSEPGMWKRRLSDEHGGKKGKALSRSIAKAGHDGIVTVDSYTHRGEKNYTTSEIVDLTHLRKGARLGQPLLKGKKEYPPLKPGSRWITVHPNGPGTKGVSIIVEPAGDGTHRVVGGAGGKLNHLRLKGVKSEAEHKEEAKERAKEKRSKQKAEDAALSPEQRKEKRELKKAKKAAHRKAERNLVEKIREKAGGIDDDIDPDTLEGLSDRAKAKLENQHHRKQFRQAMKRKDQIAHELVQERVDRLEDEAAVEATISERPDIEKAARAMGERELAAMEAEKEARQEARKAPMRVTSGAMETTDRAADNAVDHVMSLDAENLAATLEEAGGRRDARKTPFELTAPPSQEMERRALEHVDNARILADAVNQVAPSDNPERAELELQVIEDALKEHGLTLADDREKVETALRREAGAQIRESQLAELKRGEFEAMEADGDMEKAVKAMAYTDTLRGVNEQVAEAAERLGLRSKDKAPLRQAEMAEMMDILEDFDRFRQEKKELASMVTAAEPPEYDRSRRAFDLGASSPADNVVEQVEERVLRELAQRLTGVASPNRPAHAKAVADGHYSKMADIALSIADQHYVDRSVVDAIGLGNAAMLMRHALEGDGHPPAAILDSLSDHHVKEQKRLTVEALKQADAFVPGIEDAVEGVDDIEHVMKQIDAAQDDIDAAQAAVGAALGQMEATATLAQAFRGKMGEEMSLDAHGDLNGHLNWLGSIGLGPGDYAIDRKNKKITIPRESWHKMITPTDKKVVAARKTVHSIKRGDHDEAGWMPAGMVSREATTFSNPAPDAPRYHQSLDLGSENLRENLENHIGSRLNDGERPHDIEKDLLSAQVVDRTSDPVAYTDHIKELFPHDTEENKAARAHNNETRAKKHGLTQEYNKAQVAGDSDQMGEIIAQLAEVPNEREVTEMRDSHFEEHYNGLASKFMEKNHPDKSALHARSLYEGTNQKDVHEAAFRALAESPHAVAAFVPVGDLSSDQSQALRDHFYKKMGLTNRTWADEFSKHLDERVASLGDRAQAPAMGDMFGGGAPAATGADLSPENFAEQQPEHAKTLANTYPREGHDLFMTAMGERPPDAARPTNVPEEHLDALDKEHEARPHLGVPELVKRTNTRMGQDAAMKDLGITEQQITETLDGELTQRALSLRAKLKIEGKSREPRIYGGDVHDHYAAKAWDGEVQQFKDHMRRNATPWAMYVNTHGDLGRAYQSLQDGIKGDFMGSFKDHYGKVTGQPLQEGVAEVRNSALHSEAMVTPRERVKLSEARRVEIERLKGSKRATKGATDATGKAIGGTYGKGSVLEDVRAGKEAAQSHGQRQAGMFGAAAPRPEPEQTGMFGAPAPEQPAMFGGGDQSSMFGAPKTPDKILHDGPEKREAAQGERVALGQRAESELGGIIGNQLGQQFNAKQAPTKLFSGASMDGRRVHSQRVIKQLHAVHRVAAHLSTGSGKTPTSIGAFTDLHHHGKVTHGLYLVPKAVQSQFGEEMTAFTEPGKYQWETGHKKNHAERVGMLRNGKTHMRVMTHQGFAQTVTKVLADHHGISKEAIVARMRKQTDAQRADTVREAFKAQGIPLHFTYVDEAHMTTTRAGTPESVQSIMINAVSHPTNSPFYMGGTATPHKNDTSEIYSEARTLDPDRYSDRYRFTQAHGAGTMAAPDAVRREMDSMTYSAKIDPEGVDRRDTTNPTVDIEGNKVSGGPIDLHPEHQKLVDQVETDYQSARSAHRAGGVDVDAIKRLSPGAFEGVPEDQHEAIARDKAPSLGIIKETSMRKAVNLAPPEINNKLQRMVEVIQHDLNMGKWTDRSGRERDGKSSIVFTDSLEEARMVHEHLSKLGIAAGLYHGQLNGDKRKAFRSDFNEGHIRVGVMTAAGEAGINLQEGSTVHQMDIPKTAKSHQQRSGRSYRQGQKGDVDVHNWTTNTDHDRAAERRLKAKSRLAAVFQTPLGPMDEHGYAADYNAALNAKHAGFDVPDPLPSPAE